MTFAELWDQSLDLKLPPGEQQEWLRKALPLKLQAAEIAIADPARSDDRLVLGFAHYSRSDMQLLDLAQQAISKGDRVEVFFLSDCLSLHDIDRYVPGISLVFQSPVVGIWKDGTLVARGSGLEARAIVLERFRALGIDSP